MHLMKLEQKISDCESHRKQEIFKLGLDMMYNLKIEGLTVTMADLLIYLATKYSIIQLNDLLKLRHCDSSESASFRLLCQMTSGHKNSLPSMQHNYFSHVAPLASVSNFLFVIQTSTFFKTLILK